MDWISRFDELTELERGAREFLQSRARMVDIPRSQRVFAPGKKPDAFLLLLEGTVRVQQVGAGGREIVLYRVSGGESCIMTTACLLSNEDYLAEGVTETSVTAVALSKGDFDALLVRSPAFRRMVFTRYASRMTRLMELVEDVAFQRIDRRLAGKLLELSHGERVLDITHQSLAVELGTAREVITRHIKAFSQRGLIRSTRGHLEIVDRKALAELAEQV